MIETWVSDQSKQANAHQIHEQKISMSPSKTYMT